MNNLFTQTELLHSLVLFLMLGSVVGLLMGVLMLWHPRWLACINNVANHWVSTRQMGRSLDKSVSIDHWFYRYGKLSGVLLIAGAIYIVYMFCVQLSRTDLLATVARLHLLSPAWQEPVTDMLAFVFIAGAILALIVGLFLLFRPSLLRDLELGANQRVPVRQTLKSVEIQYNQLDKFIFCHIKVAGVLLMSSSLYVLVGLLYWLGR